MISKCIECNATNETQTPDYICKNCGEWNMACDCCARNVEPPDECYHCDEGSEFLEKKNEEHNH